MDGQIDQHVLGTIEKQSMFDLIGRVRKREIDNAHEICDTYNSPRHIRRDGVMAAWLVDPQMKQVIHGNAPRGWETFDR